MCMWLCVRDLKRENDREDTRKYYDPRLHKVDLIFYTPGNLVNPGFKVHMTTNATFL